MLLYLPIHVTASSDVDCSICHQGGTVIDVADTISPNSDTCFKCHDLNHPPIWEDQQVHEIHLYNILIGPREDYISRHPQTELECSLCHNHEYICSDCHTGNIPHIKQHDDDCMNCHNTMANPIEHKPVNLTKHNIFGVNAPESCDICHEISRGNLRLTSGSVIGISDSEELCKQCHSTIYKEWKKGGHWIDLIEQDTDMYTCSYCHDVHAPELLYWKPPKSNKGVIEFIKNILKVINILK